MDDLLVKILTNIAWETGLESVEMSDYRQYFPLTPVESELVEEALIKVRKIPDIV